MGEIKEKKKSPHFLFVTSASPWKNKKIFTKKKNLYMNVPCMTQKDSGSLAKKKKTSLMTKLRAISSPPQLSAGGTCTRLILPQDSPIHRLAAFDTTSELTSFLFLRTVTICGCLPSPPPTYHYHCAIV